MGESPREGRSNAGAYIAIAIGVVVLLVGGLALVAFFGFYTSATVSLSPSAPVSVHVVPAAAPTPAPAPAPQPEAPEGK